MDSTETSARATVEAMMMSPANARGKRIGFWLGVAAFLIIALVPAPGGVPQAAWLALALLALMMCWWVSEALPIGVTSLLPLVVAPMLGIASFSQTATPYASSIIFLLLGGFIIGKSVERWNLHTRIALGVLSRAGSKPTTIIAGFMVTSAVLSMWISNTATVIMLVPIVLSLAASSSFEGRDKKNFTLMALLGTAWAASIGGLGTPVGTPPNLIIIGFLEQQGDFRFTFGRWMMFGIPAVIVMLPAAYFVLTRLGPKLSPQASTDASAVFKDKLAALGKITVPERRVMIVFGCIAFFWIFRRAFIQDLTLLNLMKFVFPIILGAFAVILFILKLKNKPTPFGWPLIITLCVLAFLFAFFSTSFLGSSLIDAKPFAGLNDSLIAVAGVIALFAIPSGSAREPGTRLLDWPTAATIPWDILLLFGGGLSLAAIIKITGLSEWLGAELAFVAMLPTVVTTLILVTVVIFLTELTSNTATVAAIMPVVGAIALETGVDAAALAVPIALAASCAFMLPMATGPNAVIFGSGQVSMAQMSRYGFKLNLIGVALITGLASVLAGLVL